MNEEKWKKSQEIKFYWDLFSNSVNAFLVNFWVNLWFWNPTKWFVVLGFQTNTIQTDQTMSKTSYMKTRLMFLAQLCVTRSRERLLLRNTSKWSVFLTFVVIFNGFWRERIDRLLEAPCLLWIIHCLLTPVKDLLKIQTNSEHSREKLKNVLLRKPGRKSCYFSPILCWN